MKIFKYNTETEAQEIITRETANGLILTDVSNITEGNYLGFMDSPIQTITVDTSPQQIVELKEQNLILMDAMATIYETLLTGGIPA